MTGYWFDIDGVIADTLSQLLYEVSAVLEVEAQPQRITKYHTLYEAWPEHRESANRHIQMLFDSPFFYQRIRPREEAMEVLRVLHRRGLVSGYITSRPLFTRDSTLAWLNAYNFPSAQLVHAHDKSMIVRWSNNVLIDDNPQTVLAAVNRGANAWLFSALYNASCPHNLKRIESLWELVKEVT